MNGTGKRVLLVMVALSAARGESSARTSLRADDPVMTRAGSERVELSTDDAKAFLTKTTAIRRSADALGPGAAAEIDQSLGNVKGQISSKAREWVDVNRKNKELMARADELRAKAKQYQGAQEQGIDKELWRVENYYGKAQNLYQKSEDNLAAVGRVQKEIDDEKFIGEAHKRFASEDASAERGESNWEIAKGLGEMGLKVVKLGTSIAADAVGGGMVRVAKVVSEVDKVVGIVKAGSEHDMRDLAIEGGEQGFEDFGSHEAGHVLKSVMPFNDLADVIKANGEVNDQIENRRDIDERETAARKAIDRETDAKVADLEQQKAALEREGQAIQEQRQQLQAEPTEPPLASIEKELAKITSEIDDNNGLLGELDQDLGKLATERRELEAKQALLDAAHDPDVGDLEEAIDDAAPELQREVEQDEATRDLTEQLTKGIGEDEREEAPVPDEVGTTDEPSEAGDAGTRDPAADGVTDPITDERADLESTDREPPTPPQSDEPANPIENEVPGDDPMHESLSDLSRQMTDDLPEAARNEDVPPRPHISQRRGYAANRAAVTRADNERTEAHRQNGAGARQPSAAAISPAEIQQWTSYITGAQDADVMAARFREYSRWLGARTGNQRAGAFLEGMVDKAFATANATTPEAQFQGMRDIITSASRFEASQGNAGAVGAGQQKLQQLDAMEKSWQEGEAIDRERDRQLKPAIVEVNADGSSTTKAVWSPTLGKYVDADQYHNSGELQMQDNEERLRINMEHFKKKQAWLQRYYRKQYDFMAP